MSGRCKVPCRQWGNKVICLTDVALSDSDLTKRLNIELESAPSVKHITLFPPRLHGIFDTSHQQTIWGVPLCARQVKTHSELMHLFCWDLA